MIPRKAVLPVLLAASAGGPYLASHAPQWASQGPAATQPGVLPPAAAMAPATPFAAQGPASAEAGPSTAAPYPAASAANPSQAVANLRGPNDNLFPVATPVEGDAAYSIAEVLRFDITKEWVYQRWARKSTALADLDLFGVRVPLVSGTKLHDVAGSLTYFFGPDGRVKRISFRGQTGDTTQLVAVVTQQYGLGAQPTVVAGEQLYELRDGGDNVISRLRTKPAPVLWTSLPHASFSVELDLQDPATARPLPPIVGAPTAPAQNATLPAASAEGLSGPPSANLTASPNAAPAEPASSAPAPAPAAEHQGWRAFLPRSRMAKPQIRNLDQGNLYQW